MAKNQTPFTLTVNLFIVHEIKKSHLLEYAINKIHSMYKTIKRPFIAALPNTKVGKLKQGIYLDCIFKSSLISLHDSKRIKFVPDLVQPDDL